MLLAGAAGATAVGCAAGDGPTLADPATEVAPDAIEGAVGTDANTPEAPFELHLDGLSAEQPSFTLVLPPEDVREALAKVEGVAEEMAEAETPSEPLPATAVPASTAEPDGPTEAPTPHPLESVVIDDTPDELRPEFVWDEPAALACAHTEFALDALISADPVALDDTLDAASDWAQQSGNAEMSIFAPELASTRDADAEDLVVSVLSTCADAGYEL